MSAEVKKNDLCANLENEIENTKSGQIQIRITKGI